MIYICKNKFKIANYNEDGRCTGKLFSIRKGSKWSRNNDWENGLQKISLENLNNSKWIEITEERFKEFFEEKEYNLILHVRKEYFNKIKNGEKKFEYRLFNNYWKIRLENKEFDNLIIQLGYPKAFEKNKILKFKYQGYKIEKIKHKEFGDKPVEVFAIKLEKEWKIGDILKMIRISLENENMYMMACKLGLSTVELSQIENDKLEIPKDLIKNLKKFYKINPEIESKIKKCMKKKVKH